MVASRRGWRRSGRLRGEARRAPVVQGVERLEVRALLALAVPAASVPAASVGVRPVEVEPAGLGLDFSHGGPDAGAGQTVYLDFDGAAGLTYRGPVVLSGIAIAPFSAAAAGLAGAEAAIEGAVVAALGAFYAPWGVTFTTRLPAAGTSYSTVHVGAGDPRLVRAAGGGVSGLAEGVDRGNADRADCAFVFSDQIAAPGRSAEGYALALAEVAAHEVGHLLGFAHEDAAEDAPGPLGAVAYSTAAHDWITGQAYDFFHDQFGLTSMRDFAGDFRAGSVDEDEIGILLPDNPFGDRLPFNRHFWTPSPGFVGPRDPFDGATVLGIHYDAAPNRAIKYLTGGYGFDGSLDPSWDLLSRGAAARYDSVLPNRSGAFNFLGHIAHLLEDMSVPAHALSDLHPPEIPLLFDPDPDPYHDWVDGQVFSPLNTDPDRPTFISDINPFRYTNFGITDPDSSTIRSAYEIDPTFATGSGSPDWAPLYRLFADLAGIAEGFDTKDFDGAVERGAVRDPLGTAPGDTRADKALRYRNFSEAELNLQARTLVPEAIRRVADLIRVFYGVVDDEKPAASSVVLPQWTSHDEDQPQEVRENCFFVTVAASDQDTGDSGIGKDKFEIQYREKAPGGGWTAWTGLPDLDALIARGQLRGETVDRFPASVPGLAGQHGAMIRPVFRMGQTGYTYGFRARAEDGAGNVSDWSEESYVRVGGGPAAVLVIDRSGSMADGGKMEAARQAGSTFVSLLHDGDSIGVVGFSTSASVGFALAPVASGNTTRQDAQAAINALRPGGSTSIGSGIVAGNGQISGASAGRRALVVMSDGMENTSPRALDVIGQVPEDVRVFTIGFGADADAALLQQIAQMRGGQYFFAASNADLQQIYVSISGTATGEQDTMRNQGTIRPGDQVIQTFHVDPTACGATIGLQWPGSDLDLSLIAPDGTVITRASNDPRVRFIGGPTSEFFQILIPEPGTWRAVIDAVDVDPAGEPFQVFARVGSPIEAALTSDRASYVVGDLAHFQVRLDDGEPIRGAAVTAVLTPPAGSGGGTRVLTFVDDGRHGDAAAGDGIYGASVVLGHAGAGSYDVQVQAAGRTASGTAFVRAPSRSITVTGTGLSPRNNAPVLLGIAGQSAFEQRSLTLAARASDPDSDHLVFSLDAAPAGATIDAATGVFSWTPTEDTAPGPHPVTIRVTDSGTPAASDTTTFTITVAETNQAPSFGLVADQAVNPGATLRVAVAASDPDRPAQALRYSLDPAAPAGATIDAATGVFSWTPTAAQGPGTYTIVVRVTDGGAPALSAATAFRVSVAAGQTGPSDTAGPLVVSVQRIRPRRQPVRIEVSFNEALDAARAQDPGNYELVSAGGDGRFGTRDDRRVRIRGAALDPSRNVVALFTKPALSLTGRYRLTVRGTTPAGLADPAGNLLDGDGDGQPGGDHHALLSRKKSGAARGQRAHPRGPALAALRPAHGSARG